MISCPRLQNGETRLKNYQNPLAELVTICPCFSVWGSTAALPASENCQQQLTL